MALSDADAPASTLWKPPMASRATRKPSMNSTSSFRGGFVSSLTDRETFFESTIEANLATLLEADHSVDHFEEQPAAVTYRDDAGKPHRHTFDFRVFLRDGTRVAIAVKDSGRVEPSGIRRKLELIEAQVGTRFADRFIVRTQDDTPRSRIFNAKLVLHGRNVRDDEIIASLAAYAQRLRGAVTVSGLLDAAGVGIGGFMGVVNLIDDGLLVQVSTGRIDLQTRVRPTSLH